VGVRPGPARDDGGTAIVRDAAISVLARVDRDEPWRFRDRLILLGDAPYSGVSAAALGLALGYGLALAFTRMMGGDLGGGFFSGSTPVIEASLLPSLSFFALGCAASLAGALWRLAAAGAVVISLGVVLNIINRAGSGDRLGAVLGRFGGAGLLFYWCAILMLTGKLGTGFGLPVLGAALACWALKEPLTYLAGRGEGGKNEGGLEALAEGFVGAFEGVLLYLANTVSFARLAAYAMSHAALLASSYTLAAAADKAWGPGSLAGLLAIIAGNAAAILLEGTVAAVQALRLEYYEFFGKFFEGGGRPFRPFVLEGIK